MIEVIISHWKRPDNLAQIVGAFLGQTLQPDAITICDNSPDSPASGLLYQPPPIWRFPDNGHGPTCRFAPALYSRSKYVLLHDDDLVPGIAYLATLHDEAKYLKDQFATIGGAGRRNASGAYLPRSVPTQAQRPAAVDMTIRSHLVLTKYVHHVFRLRELLRSESDLRHWEKEDDILLCYGLQLYTGFASWICRRVGHEGRMNFHELPSNYALSGREDHVAIRSYLVKLCAKVGWNSLWEYWESRIEKWGVTD